MDADMNNLMNDDFISEEDLLTFEGFLKYQAIEPAMLTSDELAMWRGLFEDSRQRAESSPKVGLMKLQPVAGEQKYAVALEDGSDLWLTLWVRCSPKGEIFVMIPRGDRDWDPHTSYHLDGRLHGKSHGRKTLPPQKRQPLTSTFKGSEHLGVNAGHGKSTGAVCDPKTFDGMVIVEPGVLGPKHGAVGIDLVEPAYVATWERDIIPRFYPGDVHHRQIFARPDRPSVAITILRS
jgi:hypothetical protein